MNVPEDSTTAPLTASTLKGATIALVKLGLSWRTTEPRAKVCTDGTHHWVSCRTYICTYIRTGMYMLLCVVLYIHVQSCTRHPPVQYSSCYFICVWRDSSKYIFLFCFFCFLYVNLNDIHSILHVRFALCPLCCWPVLYRYWRVQLCWSEWVWWHLHQHQWLVHLLLSQWILRGPGWPHMCRYVRVHGRSGPYLPCMYSSARWPCANTCILSLETLTLDQTWNIPTYS